MPSSLDLQYILGLLQRLRGLLSFPSVDNPHQTSDKSPQNPSAPGRWVRKIMFSRPLRKHNNHKPLDISIECYQTIIIVNNLKTCIFYPCPRLVFIRQALADCLKDMRGVGVRDCPGERRHLVDDYLAGDTLGPVRIIHCKVKDTMKHDASGAYRSLCL